MKLRRRTAVEEEDGSINVSPLIDVVFILLIFFIVSATFVTLPGAEIIRPRVEKESSLQKNSVLFAISSKDQIFHAGEVVELSEISLLISQASKDKEKPVIIQVDQSADATILAKLVSEAKKVAQSVSLATLKNR
ncbi:biopolymer transporter ExbD [Opitutales bacterium]|nr:biopolymer transporter ExbD [Opitutales bacterium]